MAARAGGNFLVLTCFFRAQLLVREKLPCESRLARGVPALSGN